MDKYLREFDRPYKGHLHLVLAIEARIENTNFKISVEYALN